MFYKCLDCGHIFEEGEQSYWQESRGEYWGFPCFEEMVGCPLCRGSYEKTVKCDVCGSEHLNDELNGGVCKDCIDDYRKNFDVCCAVSIEETSAVEINALLSSLFDPSDIEQILKEHIRTNMPDVDCSVFIDRDADWFGERLAEEVNKG